jgi:hypothetical protein
MEEAANNNMPLRRVTMPEASKNLAEWRASLVEHRLPGRTAT